MVAKKTLIEWLQADSVEIISADLDIIPVGQSAGFIEYGQVVTIIVVNKKPAPLEGANIVVPEAPQTPEDEARKAAEAKRVQEGWEAE